MLEDFIQANKLNARILHRQVSGANSAKCTLFVSREKRSVPVLAVFLSRHSPDLKKMEKESGLKGLREADNRETEGITGYSKEFLPPVSVYGIRVLLDESASSAETFFFPVGDKKTLAISPEEIMECNEEAISAPITNGKN